MFDAVLGKLTFYRTKILLLSGRLKNSPNITNFPIRNSAKERKRSILYGIKIVFKISPQPFIAHPSLILLQQQIYLQKKIPIFRMAKNEAKILHLKYPICNHTFERRGNRGYFQEERT